MTDAPDLHPRPGTTAFDPAPSVDAEPETARLLRVLRAILAVLEVSNRSVENKLGLSNGYLSRLFAEAIDLKLDHIVGICNALDITPADFFQVAYPQRTQRVLSDNARRLRTVFSLDVPEVGDNEP